MAFGIQPIHLPLPVSSNSARVQSSSSLAATAPRESQQPPSHHEVLESGASAHGTSDRDALRDFAIGVGAGVRDGVDSAARSVVALAAGGYALATSGAARERMGDSLLGAARTAGRATLGAMADPVRASGTIAQAAHDTLAHAAASYKAAAGAGHAAEFVGKAVGEGLALVGAAAMPGGAPADIADVGRVAEAVTAGASRAVASDLTTAYRVEGAGNARIIVGENGSVAIPTVVKQNGAERNLYINFGDEARAKNFLAQRLAAFPDDTIKQFDVPTSFVNELRTSAVPESERSMNPQRPVIADPTKAADQFGLSGPHIERLRQAIVQGSGAQRGGQSHAASKGI